MRNTPKQFARVRAARDDDVHAGIRCAFGGSFPIQPQTRLTLTFVRPVTLETDVREDRTDVTIEANRPVGRLGDLGNHSRSHQADYEKQHAFHGISRNTRVSEDGTAGSSITRPDIRIQDSHCPPA